MDPNLQKQAKGGIPQRERVPNKKDVEITLGKGGQLARAAGAVAKLIAKEGKLATLKLPSGEVLHEDEEILASICAKVVKVEN